MKKINCWLLASLFTAALTLTACGSDDDSNNNGGGGGGEPTLTIKDLTSTTWEVWADKEKAPNVYQTLEIGADNTFKLHKQVSETEKYDYIGTWVEKDGTVLLTYNCYASTEKPYASESDVPLHFSRYGNGMLIYTDNGNVCEVFVRQGETLNVSGVSTAIDQELLGKWKGQSMTEGSLEYTFNADGTVTVKESSPGGYKYSYPLLTIAIPSAAENAPKRFIGIGHIKEASLFGPTWTDYYTGGRFYKYAISDGNLYLRIDDNIKTMEDLLKTSPLSKVTE